MINYGAGRGAFDPNSSLACYLLAPMANERINAMSDMVLNQEEEILSFEVSDEALENAAGSEQAFTLGACSGLSVCPSTAPVL